MAKWTAATLGRGAEDRAQSGLDKGDLGEFLLDQAITSARIERPRVAHSRLNQRWRWSGNISNRSILPPTAGVDRQLAVCGRSPSNPAS